METLIVITVDGFVYASWLFIVAVGMTLVCGVMKILNLAHGERHQGHIINIGSVVGSYPMPANTIYGATKAFVRQFSLCLRADVLGTGVRVTDVAPGLSGGTEFSVVKLGDAEKAKTVYSGLTPLSAVDIANAVSWVLDQPPHVNVNILELMPVDQAFGFPAFNRK